MMSTGRRCHGIPRRELLRVGGLTALGLGLGDFFRLGRTAAAGARKNGSGPKPKAKACILIWLAGGPSHLETFDPKPDAPSEVRGPLGTLPTKLPGVRLSECLQQTAEMIDKIAIVRSMTSTLGEHNFGTQYLMTGYKPSPALEYPAFGSTLAHVQTVSSVLPPHIAIPNSPVGSGYLPGATRPFSVGDNPRKGDLKVRDLDFYEGLNLTRLDRRRQIVSALDLFSREKDASATPTTDPDLERAYNLIASPEAKGAFDLSDEPSEIRDRYGRASANGIGQSCLLARRLVERGVPFVTVNSNGWDTHQDVIKLKERYPTDRNAPLPSLDRALSALLQDLTDRERLDETLVIVMGEFGRTPKINSVGGRDHWPAVFSVALAGGGVRGGQIIGSSDGLGEYPKDRPVTPADLAATIYTLLGVDPRLELHTSDGRPVRVAPHQAKVVSELFA